jgi:hypothetical protein
MQSMGVRRRSNASSVLASGPGETSRSTEALEPRRQTYLSGEVTVRTEQSETHALRRLQRQSPPQVIYH